MIEYTIKHSLNPAAIEKRLVEISTMDYSGSKLSCFSKDFMSTDDTENYTDQSQENFEIYQNIKLNRDKIEIAYPNTDLANYRKKESLTKPYVGRVLKAFKKYILKASDRIQCGLTNFIICEINSKNGFESLIQIPSEVNYIDPLSTEPNSECCKICAQAASEANDFLISFCNCKGTCMYVHVTCIQKWIKVQLSSINKNPAARFYMFNFKSLTCDLCHQNYPPRIQIKGQIYDLFEIERPKGHYIIIEKVDPTGIRTMAMIRDYPKLTIGRGLDQNVILHDASGSRKHAQITYEDGAYMIEDMGSKFGTILELRGDVILSENEEIELKYKSALIMIRNNKRKQGAMLEEINENTNEDFKEHSISEPEEVKCRTENQDENGNQDKVIKSSKKIKKIKNIKPNKRTGMDKRCFL